MPDYSRFKPAVKRWDVYDAADHLDDISPALYRAFDSKDWNEVIKLAEYVSEWADKLWAMSVRGSNRPRAFLSGGMKLFTIDGKDMADLLRALHIARIDANAYMDADEAEDLCPDHMAELGTEAAHSAAILCSTVQYLLFNKDNWKG